MFSQEFRWRLLTCLWEHHLGILQVQFIIPTSVSIRLHERQLWPVTWAMAADFDAERMHVELEIFQPSDCKRYRSFLFAWVVDWRDSGCGAGTPSLRWYPLGTWCSPGLSIIVKITLQSPLRWLIVTLVCFALVKQRNGWLSFGKWTLHLHPWFFKRGLSTNTNW